MLAWLLAGWVAWSPIPNAAPDEDLAGVSRAYRLEFGRTEPIPEVTYLPARVGLQFEIQAGADTLQHVLDVLPPPYRTRIEPSELGHRVVITHDGDAIRAATRIEHNARRFTLELGTQSEQNQLRVLAALVRRPLPEPGDLGAHLELWRDAERATSDGDLTLARKLWEKLQQTSNLDDLAALRVAELYIISGHVNEASARLQQVSRRYPRSTGASLARLDLLHVQTITDIARATVEQVELAAETIDRRRFEGYAWLRAALVLDVLGETSLALARLPPPDALPEDWKGPADLETQRILTRAIAVPVWRNDPVRTVAAWNAWSGRVDAHPSRAEIIDSVIEAHAQLGLFEPTIALIRARLRELPTSAEEGALVVRLAQAYQQTSDLVRAGEVVSFICERHPQAPQLRDLLRTLALESHAAHGLAGARERLAQLRPQCTTAEHRKMLGELEADLAVAYGDAALQVQVLRELSKLQFGDPAVREPQFALALARANRPAEAAPMLRSLVGRTTDPEARDKLAYHLATSEIALGNDADARKILEHLASAGTRYGLIARAHLRGLELERLLASPAPTPAQEPTP